MARRTDYTTDDKIKDLIANGVESLAEGNDRHARAWWLGASKSLQFRGLKLREAMHTRQAKKKKTTKR